jgi:hypothetical protein
MLLLLRKKSMLRQAGGTELVLGWYANGEAGDEALPRVDG